MISMGSESGGRKMTQGHKDSLAVAESCTKQSVGGGGALKKGPWTSAEDAILLEYVTKHGEGNWNAVQKNSGLSRCGKSCRLRWANHLRPDLKKGAFTLEEERLVIALHAKIGNKWSRMATQLPGRTDNEIKNFWNTRIKRLQRTGSPIYPPGVCEQLQAMNGAQEGPNMGTSQAGDTHHSYMLDGDRFVIPEAGFKNLELDQEIYSYTEPLLELPISSFMFPKRPRESEALFPCVDGNSISNSYPFGSDPFDPDFDYNHQFPFGGVPGSHACVNGNSSSSELLSKAMMKSELPSLQYSETQQGSWDSLASSLPSLESVDTLIQSPPTKQSTEAECISPRSDGLLEAIVYASQPLKRQKKSSEWDIDGDLNSHLGYSVASEFSECTPISQMAETMPGCDVKPEEVSQVSTQNVEKNIDFSVPDSFIDWSWFGRDSKQNKDQGTPSDAIGALLGEDRSSDMQPLSHFKVSRVSSDL